MDRNTFEPGPLAKVEFHLDNDRTTLVFIRELRHSPEKIWVALTDPVQLRMGAVHRR